MLYKSLLPICLAVLMAVSPCLPAAADLDGNRKVDASDYLLMLKLALRNP